MKGHNPFKEKIEVSSVNTFLELGIKQQEEHEEDCECEDCITSKGGENN